MFINSKIAKGKFLIPILLLVQYSFGQWVIKNKSFAQDSIKFKIDFSSFNEINETVCFIEAEKCGGYELENFSLKSLPKYVQEAFKYYNYKDQKGKSTKIPIEGILNLKNKTSLLSLSLYTQNIKSFTIILKDFTRGWMIKDFHVQNPGYADISRKSIQTWETEKMSIALLDEDLRIEEISVYAFPKNPNKAYTAYLGTLKIEETISSEILLYPWLDRLLVASEGDILLRERQRLEDFSSWSKATLDNGRLSTYYDFNFTNGYHNGLVQFAQTGNKTSEREFFEFFFTQIIKHYPFYQDKNLDATEVLKNFGSYSSLKYANNRSYYKDIEIFLQDNFDDPHFKIVFPRKWKENLSKGPIRVLKINDIPTVAAVFNSSLKYSLPLGSHVIAIDGKHVNENTSSKTIEKLMLKNKQESIVMKYMPPEINDTLEATIQYDVKLNIDKKFKKKQSEFLSLKNDVNYLRLRNWKGNSHYHLVNRLEDIRGSKGLIIDLRGNGGGYTNDALQTLSLFIKKPIILGSLEFPKIKESLIIFPSKEGLRVPSDLSIVILVDKNTACASELFILGIKKNKSIIVLGDSPTMGTLSSPITFFFPSGVGLQAHYSHGKFVINNKDFVEGNGIDPDVWVSKTNIADLAPYNDKVLQVAQVFLKNINN